MTLPIVALAAATFGVVLVSLGIGARETDSFALSRQRETIRHALVQHGHSLSRELRMQTVWTEGYETTRARDLEWIHANYGTYLSELLGYDAIFILGPDNSSIYGYAPREGGKSDFASVGPAIADLVQAVRNPRSVPADYDVTTTEVMLAGGKVLHHNAVADVRKINGRPATVVVSTILPDRGYNGDVSGAPMLLVAIEEVDTDFTRQLGRNFGFDDMKWVGAGTPPGAASDVIKSLAGATVGTIVWRKNRPGLEFIRHVAPASSWLWFSSARSRHCSSCGATARRSASCRASGTPRSPRAPTR